MKNKNREQINIRLSVFMNLKEMKLASIERFHKASLDSFQNLKYQILQLKLRFEFFLSCMNLNLN